MNGYFDDKSNDAIHYSPSRSPFTVTAIITSN